MNLETVLYDVRDGVATITLNRPEAMNAWTPQLSDELSLAMGAADADDAKSAPWQRPQAREDFDLAAPKFTADVQSAKLQQLLGKIKTG